MTQKDTKQPVIVVGHDGSDRGADALALGALIARSTGGRLVVGGWYREEYPVFPGSEELENDLRRMALEPLERIQTGLLGVPVELRAVKGRSPAQALHRLAERKDADIVVVGSTHRGRLGRVLPGSTGQRLLQEAPCAVAIAPLGFAAADDHELKLVAAAFEATVEGRQAAHMAAELAMAAGAQLLVISVVEPGMGLYGPGLSPEMYASIRTANRDRAQRELDALVASFPSGLGVEGVLLEGTAAAELGRAFQDGSIDLAVMGSRAYGPLGRALAGSVAGAVVREAPCPVVIVPRTVAERETADAGAREVEMAS